MVKIAVDCKRGQIGLVSLVVYIVVINGICTRSSLFHPLGPSKSLCSAVRSRERGHGLTYLGHFEVKTRRRCQKHIENERTWSSHGMNDLIFCSAIMVVYTLINHGGSFL